MISVFKQAKYCSITPLPWLCSVITKLNMSVSETEEKVNIHNLKREASEQLSELDVESSKRALIAKQERIKKRKVAMLIAYMGQGYLGLQRNPGMKTIEEDLLVALLKAGFINDEAFEHPQLIQFQRAARTDKGVSALRQVLSLKLPENSNTEAINKYLPEQVRAIAIKRVTRGFNCKSNCDARTYSYTMPTFAFAPTAAETTEAYRLSTEVQENINQTLKLFEGTHNFHNFTSRKMPTDPSVHRYMMNFTCGKPFVRDDLEFVILKVKGQSFMLHQIRKMVGLTIAIVRGLTTTDTIEKSWEKDKLDIPIAPGLGLLLEEVHYDRYNFRYGSDGMHETITWEDYNAEVEEFKERFILKSVVETEKSEKSMLSWLDLLNLHSFDVRTDHVHVELDKALERNQDKLSPPNKLDALIAAAYAVETER